MNADELKKAAADAHDRGYVDHELSNDPQFWKAVREEGERRVRAKAAREAIKVLTK